MHPVARESAECAFGLGNLVFMVGEDEVRTATVDVEAFTQITVRHGRALDMPARAARPPRALPRRLARLCRLPQREIERALLVLTHLDACAGLEFLGALPREAAVVGKPGHRIVHITARGVGQTAFFQPADDVDHLGDVQGGAGLYVGHGHAQAVHVGRHGLRVDPRDLGGRPSFGQPFANDFVVDVGDVAHVAHVKPARAQVTHNHVEGDRRARMTNVAEIVHSHAAHVEGDLARLARLEFHLLLGPRVVQANHIGPPMSCPGGAGPTD